MSDLISRQAAIDVVKRLMGDYELSRTVQTGLHILPSAQPEIIYCGECKNMLPNGRCLAFADLSIRPMASDYCSKAERRQDE